jgi:hypothetical protein
VLGLVELVDRAARRGAIEHYYTASVRPTITDEGWGKLPEIVKRAHFGGILQTAIAHVVSAAEAGGFDREDIHYSRTTGRLDAKAWTAVARELARVLKKIEEIVDQSESRIASGTSPDWEEATALIMLFSGPSAKILPAPRSAKRQKDPASDSLEGLPEG